MVKKDVGSIKKVLSTNQAILVLMTSKNYNDLSIDIVKKLPKKNICYVSFNKTCNALYEAFKKKKIDVENVVVIDTISKTIKKVAEEKRCYFVSSPNALTELSLVISKFLKYDFDYFIFDSLTNLAVYHKKDAILKFFSSIINRIRATKTKAIFYALDVKEQEALCKEVCMFLDMDVDLTK